MKVIVAWGSRNTIKKYQVQGKILEEIAKFLKGQETSGWGRFEYEISYWVPGADAEGNVSVVRLSLSSFYLMPTWPGYREALQTHKDRWDAMWKALKKHEDCHRDNFEQGVKKLISDYEALKKATAPQVDAMYRNAKGQIDTKDDSYDRETDHGRARGVML